MKIAFSVCKLLRSSFEFATANPPDCIILFFFNALTLNFLFLFDKPKLKILIFLKLFNFIFLFNFKKVSLIGSNDVILIIFDKFATIRLYNPELLPISKKYS